MLEYGASTPGAQCSSRSPASGLPTETPPGPEMALERDFAWRTKLYKSDDRNALLGQMRALSVAVPGVEPGTFGL